MIQPLRFWDLAPKRTALITGILTLIVYWLTLARTIFAFDSAELATAIVTLGIVHGPGYVVNLLLAHLLTYLPIGSFAFRVNLFSAVATVAAIYFFVLLLLPLVKQRLVVVVAALTFAFGFYTWSLSVVAEVYTLQLFFLAAIFYLLWGWQQNGEAWRLLTAVFLLSLAAANSPATVLWWPGFGWIIFTSPHVRNLLAPSMLLKLLGVGLLGLLPLLYLPIRSAANPAFVYAGEFDATGTFHPLDLTQLNNLLWYLSGGQFDSLLFQYTGAAFFGELLIFIQQLLAAFLGVGLPLGLWGLGRLWQRQRTLTIGLLFTLLSHGIFFVAYGAPDKATMFLPVYFIWSIFVAFGLEGLLEMVPQVPQALIFLLPLGLLLLNGRFIDVRQFDEVSETAVSRLEQAEPNAVFLAHWGDASAMEYHQLVNGLRPDVDIINVFFVPDETLAPLADGLLENGRF
ncbi:MAG: DUF2723 domain-containing protein, partial [Chloroflexota bacterium]